MFGNHGHSHGSSDHNHSHGGGHNHSHGGHVSDVGFGDDDEKIAATKTKPPGQTMNPMMAAMMMMKQANESGHSHGDGSGNMMMPQMSPEMMEMAKKMMEQRQILMKEYMEKGGPSNPAAMQEMMTKAAQMQQTMMAQFKSSMANKEKDSQLSIKPDETSIPTPDNNSLLAANINHSKLDELINKRGTAFKKKKEEEETKILSQIQNKDYSELNAIRATQYGILERLKELVDAGKCDPNVPDDENVYLLHWAAINNRVDIAKYLLSVGCKVDPIGGELESTPLNWASRSGHIQMVVFLIQNGANPLLFDSEGFSIIHLATMFGHSIVVAYLLSKGVDVC